MTRRDRSAGKKTLAHRSFLETLYECAFVQMKILAVFPGQLPAPQANNGVPVMSWALVRTLLDAGHSLSVCSTKPSRLAERWKEDQIFLESEGIKVQVLRSVSNPPASRVASYFETTRKSILPTLADYYPEIHQKSDFKNILESERPDVLYFYTLQALALKCGLETPPCLTALVDLDNLVLRFRREYRTVGSVRKRVVARLNQFGERKLPKFMIDMLRPCDAVIDHAFHHAEWLRHSGVPQAQYLPNPVLDCSPLIRKLFLSSECTLRKQKPTFALVGNVEGIATVAGLNFFAEEVLPELMRLLGPDGFSVKIIGRGRLPKRMEQYLGLPSVSILGFVEDLAAQVADCHALVVPTPIGLGFRTRIAEAFSWGCCVVSHSANQLGMPEIQHEKNALVATAGATFASEMVRAARDHDLRRELKRGARDTYETKLDGRKICKQVAQRLTNLQLTVSRHTGRTDIPVR